MPSWSVSPGRPRSAIASTWEVTQLDRLFRPAARRARRRLDDAAHRRRAADAPERADPDLGISMADIAAYVDGFARGGPDRAAHHRRFDTRADLPDVISRATVSTGVIRDSILRTARALAMARGLCARRKRADRPGRLRAALMGRADRRGRARPCARHADRGARRPVRGQSVPLPEGEGVFIDLYARAAQTRPRSGATSSARGRPIRARWAPRAAAMRRSWSPRAGSFASRADLAPIGRVRPLELVQGETTDRVSARTASCPHRRLAAPGAPEFKERRVPLARREFDPAQPVPPRELTATRPAETAARRCAPNSATNCPTPICSPPRAARLDEPLWVNGWREKRPRSPGWWRCWAC